MTTMIFAVSCSFRKSPATSISLSTLCFALLMLLRCAAVFSPWIESSNAFFPAKSTSKSITWMVVRSV